MNESNIIQLDQFFEETVNSIEKVLAGQNKVGIDVMYNSEFINAQFSEDSGLLRTLFSSIILDNIINKMEVKVNVWYSSHHLGSIRVKKTDKKKEISRTDFKKNDFFSFDRNKSYSKIANNCLEVLNENVYILSNYSSRVTNFVIKKSRLY